jgi:hypothetical protein
MNYVDPNYEPPLFGRPADVPVPPGGPVKVVNLTAHQFAELNQQAQQRFMSSGMHAVFTDWNSQTLTFTDAAPGAVTYVLGTNWQALAEFRADVIAELRNEIAALKMDRDAKIGLARGLGAIIKNVPPTKGEVLARAIRADTPHNAYGR